MIKSKIYIIKSWVKNVLHKIISQLLSWNIWIGAFFAFIIPFGISRIVKWLRG
jgi:hypothetical protein